MAIQNNQWQYRGLTVSGSYQRIVRIQWEADSTKTYYDDTLNNGTVREEANVNVRLGTYANYNERTGSDKHIVKEEDIFIKVPLGTQIYDESDFLLVDMVEQNQKVQVLPGGKGGNGNVKYSSSTNQYPVIAQSGEEGEELNVRLDLKLLGDVGLVGAPNAGKSSLINHLSNRDVAIVSEIAGTTRDVIETHLNIDGYPVIVSDTAGIRESKNEIEKKGIKLSLNRAEEADLKLVVIDVKKLDFTDILKGLLEENAILVINKSDLLEGDINPEIKKINHVLISIKENLNIDELILKIKNNFKNKFITSDDIFITRERHRQHLKQCLDHLENFNKKNESEDFDKAAEDLRLATRHLGMIVGKVDVEEILGSIFNDFCIGK